MSSSESLSFESKISHSNPEINKRLQEVIGKVLKVLEDNPELKKDFTEKFKSIFDMVTNDTEKLNVLLSNIESKMIGELKNLYNEFQNTPNLGAIEARIRAKEIISRYTHMGQFALQNSIKPSTQTA